MATAKRSAARDPDTGFPAIELVCGALSPELDHEGASGVRFSCQKIRHHRGAHAIALVWDGGSDPLLAEPPWRASV